MTMLKEQIYVLLRQTARQLGIDHEAMEFENIVALAEDALKRDPALLVDLVRLLGRRLQAHRLSLALKAHEEVDELPGLPYERVWFSEVEPITPEGESLFSLQARMEVNERQVVHLGRDLVLPLAWRRDRLLNTLTYIGPGKRWGHGSKISTIIWWSSGCLCGWRGSMEATTPLQPE